MGVDVATVPYSTIILHCLKYPHSGVYGILLGTKNGNKIKISSAVPLSHESSPLAPTIEVALAVVHASYPNIVGVYYSNQNYKDKSLNPYAVRLAESVTSVCGTSAVLVQVINWNLSPDCESNSLAAYVKDGESWKDVRVGSTNGPNALRRHPLDESRHRLDYTGCTMDGRILWHATGTNADAGGAHSSSSMISGTTDDTGGGQQQPKTRGKTTALQMCGKSNARKFDFATSRTGRKSVLSKLGVYSAGSHNSQHRSPRCMGSHSSEPDIVLLSSGTLLKWTNYMSGWRERYFEIKHGQLMYYASKADQAAGCRGSVSLKKIDITLHEFNECEFSVSVGDVVWYLRAENPHSRIFWIKALSKYSNDSDYSSNTTKTHSRNTSLSSLKLGNNAEEQTTMVSRIAELEAYRTMYREQMSSIRRELQQIGVPQAKILSIHATHVAMLDNINQIIQLAKNERGSTPKDDWAPNTPVSPCAASPLPVAADGEMEASNENTLCQNTAPHSVNDVTSDCGDEWHDADEHSSLSLDSAEEATERRTPPIPKHSAAGDAADPPQPQQQPMKEIEKPKRTLLFGDYDTVSIPKTHMYYDLVEELAKDQLRYALAGVEDNVWTLFAEDGAMKMYTREETVDGGLPVDPLKAVHEVQGVSALEFMHYFFDDKYKMDWDHTLNGMDVVERISRDTIVLRQKHKTVWPAAPRESLFISHIRRVDHLKNKNAHDLYIVCNKDVERTDVPSGGVRVGLTVSMICETVIKNDRAIGDLTRDDVLCKVIYVSQVHPGGWVPTAALRHVYKREYPKFLRTFTSYVLKNVKNKPLSI